MNERGAATNIIHYVEDVTKSVQDAAGAVETRSEISAQAQEIHDQQKIAAMCKAFATQCKPGYSKAH